MDLFHELTAVLPAAAPEPQVDPYGMLIPPVAQRTAAHQQTEVKKLQDAMLQEQKHARDTWSRVKSVTTSAMLLQERQSRLDDQMRKLFPRASQTHLTCSHCFGHESLMFAGVVLRDMSENPHTLELFQREGFPGLQRMLHAFQYARNRAEVDRQRTAKRAVHKLAGVYAQGRAGGEVTMPGVGAMVKRQKVAHQATVPSTPFGPSTNPTSARVTTKAKGRKPQRPRTGFL